MGLFNPALLLLGLAVAVPLVLHLLQRQQGPRMVFPALRYLRRAEKENARRIKLRQILLLALRMIILLLIATAAARPFLRRGGGGHEPTAVAIVLDNSLSTGLVTGEERVLDQLKSRALETLDRARPEDRFWLIRAGSPWDPAVPGTAEEIAARVRETEVTAGTAEIGPALERARALLAAGAEGRATEIHLLTDLQATGFSGVRPAGPDADVPVLIWSPRGDAPANTAVAAVEVGGGIPPRAGERSTVSARVTGPGSEDTITVRLAVGDRIIGAANAPIGSEVVLPFPARPAGPVTGWVELDPDALRADDRRYFVVDVQPPPKVGLAQRIPFVAEALDVLEGAGRLERTDAASADIVIAPAAMGIGAIRSGKSAIILAPSSALELPAANRRLAEAGIPWRFTPPSGSGEARLAVDRGEDELLGTLEDVRIREAYGIARQDGAADPDTVLLRLRSGEPWAVRGEVAGGGRYLIVASPLSAEASTLPTSPAMLPLFDRLVGAWSASEQASTDAAPGSKVPLPAGATAVERPDGQRDPVDAATEYRAPGQPGIYRILAGDRMIGAFAVNPDPSESALDRLTDRQLRAALGAGTYRLVNDEGDWQKHIYRQRLGREVWRPLLLLALSVLLIEGLVAASGRTGRRSRQDDPVSSRPRPRTGVGTGEPMPEPHIS